MEIKRYNTMKMNEVTKQPKEIKAEISVEIIGEDDAPKVEQNNHWAVIAVLSLIALIASLFINGIAFLISLTVFIVSTNLAMDKSFELLKRSNGGYDEDYAAPCDCLHFDDGGGL